MTNCPHLWLLDDEKYFEVKRMTFRCFILFIWRHLKGMSFYYKFPAKCHLCKVGRYFTREEWLEHKREQGV